MKLNVENNLLYFIPIEKIKIINKFGFTSNIVKLLNTFICKK